MRTILKQYWGYDDFRGIQRDIIESICAGNDTLGLMPTGGGKSITFQVPAMAMEGTCIVITPLIALMKDQVNRLRHIGIKAEAIYSGRTHQDILRILDNCILGGVKLLYVSPERLASQLFQKKLSHMRVSFITVDEAHCISQWGYDFRPAYLEIVRIRDIHPKAPVLALTATATPRVIEDITQKLSVPSPSSAHGPENAFRVFRMSFERKNLAYIVRRAADKLFEMLTILQQTTGPAIVYVHSRRHAKEVADYLNEAGQQATFYHAGLDHATKDRRQRDWQHDQVRIMVATNAFGMGIDKADVRCVIHYDCPDSPEAYFQEAGRAGRDGQHADAILLVNGSDRAKLEKRIGDTFPEREYIKKVYEHLAYYYQIATGDGYGVLREFNIDDFCRRFHHFPIHVHSSLLILQRAGYLEYDEEPDSQARVRFLVGRDDLYRLEQVTPAEDRVMVAILRKYGGLFADYGYIDEETIAQQAGLTTQQTYDILKELSRRHLMDFIPRRNIPTIRYLQRRVDGEDISLPRDVYEERKEQYRERIQAMLHYAMSDSPCRSRQLLAYFGEATAKDCGQCDVCRREQKKDVPRQDLKSAEERIKALVADGRRHHVTELFRLALPTDVLDAAVSSLISEEHIVQEDGFIRNGF